MTKQVDKHIGQHHNKPINRLLGVFIFATVVTFFSGTYTGLQNIALYGLTPALFLIALIWYRQNLQRINTEIGLYFLFIGLSLLSFFYPDYSPTSFTNDFPKMIAAFMCAFIALSFNQNGQFERFFHFGFITSIVLLIFFEYRVGNFSLVGFINPTVSRGDFLNNANYYSYISLFANFSLFRLHLLYKNKFTFLGLLLLPPLMLAMSFVTQSRSGLLFILAINIFFWYWVANSAKQKSYIKILRFMGLAFITVILAFQFIQFYNESSIRNRVEATERDARGALVEVGLEAFMDHPFLGVGLGQFPRYSKTGLFTHNTYVEALAEHGFFIGGLVILVFILPLFKATTLLRRYAKDPLVKLNFLCFFIFMFYNNVYVFYKASSGMMFFFLWISIQKRLIEDLKIKTKVNVPQK